MIKDYPNIKVTFPPTQLWTDEAGKQKGGIFEPFTLWNLEDEEWIEYKAVELNSSIRVKKLDSPMKTTQNAITLMKKMIRLKGTTIEMEA